MKRFSGFGGKRKQEKCQIGKYRTGKYRYIFYSTFFSAFFHRTRFSLSLKRNESSLVQSYLFLYEGKLSKDRLGEEFYFYNQEYLLMVDQETIDEKINT